MSLEKNQLAVCRGGPYLKTYRQLGISLSDHDFPDYILSLDIQKSFDTSGDVLAIQIQKTKESRSCIYLSEKKK